MLREVIQGLPGGARKHPPPAPGTATPRIAILGTGFGGLGMVAAYNRAAQKRMHRTVWEAGCSSWYKDASGKVTNNWPTFTVEYWLATRHPRFGAYRSR